MDVSLQAGGWGQRDHSWGVRDWWLLGHVWFAVRLEDGTLLTVWYEQMKGSTRAVLRQARWDLEV